MVVSARAQFAGRNACLPCLTAEDIYQDEREEHTLDEQTEKKSKGFYDKI